MRRGSTPQGALAESRDLAQYLLAGILRAPENGVGTLLVRHPVGVGDRLHLQAPRRLEIDDRLTRGGSLGDRHRAEQGPNAFRAQVFVGGLDVVDVERDVIAAD